MVDYLYLGLSCFAFLLLGIYSQEKNNRILCFGMMTTGIILGLITALSG
jgi:hypothetical protein